MATDSSHRVIMGNNVVATFSRLFLIGSFLYLQVARTCMKARSSSTFAQIGHPTAELGALERLKNPHRLIMGKTLLPLFSSPEPKAHR